MAAHAYKFAPGRAEASMGTITRRVPSAGIATQSNKERFRMAVTAYKTATGANSTDVAAALDMPRKSFNHAMSSDPKRPVSLSQVHSAEALAQSAKAPVTEAEIVQAVRDLVNAEARFERVKRVLMEGAA